MTNNKVLFRNILTTASTLAITLGAIDAMAAAPAGGQHVILNAAPIAVGDSNTKVSLVFAEGTVNGAINGDSLKLNEDRTALYVKPVTTVGAFDEIRGIDVNGKVSAIGVGAQDFKLGVVVNSVDATKLKVIFTGANTLTLTGLTEGAAPGARIQAAGGDAQANDYSALDNIDFKAQNATVKFALQAGPAIEITSNIGSTDTASKGKLHIVNGNINFKGNIGSNVAVAAPGGAAPAVVPFSLSEIIVDTAKSVTFSGATVNANQITIGQTVPGVAPGVAPAVDGSSTITFGSANGTEVTSINGIDGVGMNNTIKIQNKATLNANVGANIQLIELQNGSELIVNNKAIHDAALIKAAVDGSGELVLINVNTTADIGEALTKLGKVTFLNLDNAGAGFVALAHDVHANILDIAGTTALKIDNKIQAATTVISSTPDTAKLVVDGNTNVNFNIEGANVEFTGDDDLTVEADKMVNSKVTAAADTGAIIFQGATDSQNLEMGTDAAKLRLVQFSNGAAVGNVDASVYGIFANDITVDDNVSVHAEEFGGNLNLAGVNSAFYLADNGSVSVGNVVRGPGKFYTKGNATIEVDIAAAVWNMEGDDAEVTIHTDISAATVNQTAQNLVLAHDVAFANAYNANGSMITLGTNTLTFNGAATFEGDNFVNLTYNNNTTYGKIIDATRAITINAGATVAVTVTCADETLIAHDAVLTFINTNIVAGDPQDARLTFSFATPEGLINGLSGVTDGNVGTVRINATARDQRIAVEAVRVEAARVEAARVFAEEFARFADMDVDDAADARVAARAEALQVAQAGQAGRAPVGAGNVVERRVVDTIHLPQSCAAIEQKFISLREKHKNATTNEQHNVAAKDHAVVWKELFAEVQKSSSEEWAQNHDAVTQVVQVLADASQNPTTVDNTNKSAKYSYDGLFLFIANDTKTTPERVEHIMNNMDDNNPFALHETAKIVAARETAQHKAVATTAVAHAEMAVHTGITGATTRIASISPITHAPVGGSDLEASAQGIAAGSSAEKHGVWGQVMGGIATQKARKGAAGFKSNMIGSMVGADTMINDNATLGVAFGNVANNVKMKDLQKGDKTRSSSWVFSGYGNYQFDNDFFIRGAVAYTRTAVNNTEKRQITNTQSGLAKAKYNVNSFGGELTVGKAFAAGGVTVIPSVGARLTHTGKISYKEGGNTGLNTAISQGAMNSLYGVAGLQVTKAFVNGDSIITPEAHANVQYGLGMKTPKGKFISQLDNKAVSYVGNKPSRFSADVGCGIMAETGALEYGVAYDANIAAGYVGHQGTVKLKVKF